MRIATFAAMTEKLIHISRMYRELCRNSRGMKGELAVTWRVTRADNPIIAMEPVSES